MAITTVQLLMAPYEHIANQLSLERALDLFDKSSELYGHLLGNSFDGEIERATYPRQFEDRFSLDGVRASIRLKTVWRDIDEDFPRVYGVLFTWKQAGIDITPSSYLLRRILDSDIGLPVFSGRNWQAAMKVEDDVPAHGISLVRSLGVGPGTRYVSLADRAGKKVWLAHERNPEDIVL